jgi:hypothetical protein
MNATTLVKQLELTASAGHGSCRLCSKDLSVDEDLTNLVCDACIVLPEARRLGILLPLSKVAMTPPKLSQELESQHSSNIAVQKVVRSRTGQSMLEAVTDIPESDTVDARRKVIH